MSNPEKHVHTAVCPFCGQVTQIELETAEPSDQSLEAAAVKACECGEAVLLRRKQAKIADAKDCITEKFKSGVPSCVAELLAPALKYLFDGAIDEISIKINPEFTGKVAFTGDNFTIERKDVLKTREEI